MNYEVAVLAARVQLEKPTKPKITEKTVSRQRVLTRFGPDSPPKSLNFMGAVGQYLTPAYTKVDFVRTRLISRH